MLKKLEGVDRIYMDLSRDMRQAVVNTVMNFRVLQNAVNFVSSLETVSFSIRTFVLYSY